MKRYVILATLAITLCGCIKNKVVEDHYSFEKIGDSEFMVCVNRPKLMIEEKRPEQIINACGRWEAAPGLYIESDNECDAIPSEVVDYKYCMSRQLAFKTENGITSCYDRIHKVHLPIKYCLPDPDVNVSNNSSTVVMQNLRVY